MNQKVNQKTVEVDSSKKHLGKHGPKVKLGFRRGILPPMAGILVTIGILGMMNSQLLIAQFKYRATQSAVVAATSSASGVAGNNTGDDTTSPNPELGPRLTIPTIGVEAPVVFEQGTAEWQIQTALRSGVVHYGGSVQPGDMGNVVIFGHSSGQPWAPGDYKFVFTLLDKVKAGEKIYLDNKGTRYTYKVIRTEVVTPTDVGVLNSGNDHELTLITCTPVGTSKNRLVVHAEQVSPKVQDGPKGAKPASSVPVGSEPKNLPGSAR